MGASSAIGGVIGEASGSTWPVSWRPDSVRLRPSIEPEGVTGPWLVRGRLEEPDRYRRDMLRGGLSPVDDVSCELSL